MAETGEQTQVSEKEGQSETRQAQIGSRIVVNTGPGIAYDGEFGELAEIRINRRQGEYYLVADKGGDRRPFTLKDILITEPLREGEELQPGTNVVVDSETPLYNGVRGVVKARIPGGYSVAPIGDAETRNFHTEDLKWTFLATPLIPKASQIPQK